MNDEEILSMLRRSLNNAADAQDGAYLAETPDSIMDRARRRLLRRGAAGASMGAAVLAIGLGTVFGAGSHPAGAAAGQAVHISQDGWSVSTGSHGIVHITIRELANPAQLRKALAKAGVPARVVVGTLCSAKGGNIPGNNGAIVVTRHRGQLSLAINPARMPRGSELLISVVIERHQDVAIGFSLIRNGAALSCHRLTPLPAPVPSPSPTAVPTPSPTARGANPVPSPSS
jgi:hypothetical protein